MIRNIFMFLSLLAAVSAASGQKTGKELALSAIPDSLREGADAVVRYSITTLKVSSEKNILYRHHYAVTVLNRRGYRASVLKELYDKEIHFGHFRGVVYDASGRRVKKLSASDLLDVSATGEGTLYQDDRMKVLLPNKEWIPFTVEYEFTKTYDGTVYFPPWAPQDHLYLGVEEASFTMTASPFLLPRYRSVRLSPPKEQRDEGVVTLSWRTEGLPPRPYERLMPPLEETVPVLYLAPQHFRYARSEGSMLTWAEVGRWIASLNKGRQELPPATVEKIRRLTASLSNPVEKARKVYHYMQQHTRYVSVQLGIGGYQPYPAKYVDEKGYGDCKALCNYTCALMQAAGVEARYVVVAAGTAGDILTDFPSNQFNHAIVALPFPHDTIWLECTDQHQPFGFLGSFTADRHALMITGDSGVLVHTPVYEASMNTQYRTARITLLDDGTATARVTTRYSGIQYENVEAALTLTGEKLKKWYYRRIDIPDFTLDKITLRSEEGPPPVAVEEAAITVRRYMTRQGQRAFLPLNLMNKVDFLNMSEESRKNDIFIAMGFTDVDTIVWALPAGMRVQYMPRPVMLTSPFGTYESRVTQQDDGTVLYVRRLVLRKGRFPGEMYGELRHFGQQISSYDHKRILLRKEE